MEMNGQFHALMLSLQWKGFCLCAEYEAESLKVLTNKPILDMACRYFTGSFLVKRQSLLNY